MKWFSLSLLAVSSLAMADTLIHNAKGYRYHEGSWQPFTWMLVDDGKITAIGNGEPARAAKAGDRDLNGAQVLPGLIDAHGHVYGFGLEQQQVDLRGTASLEEALARVKAFADKHPDRRWIVGRGWNQVLWPGKQFPTAADLDKVISDRPVMLKRVDGHAAWVNSKALKLAGITTKTADPQGGQILRDEQSQATGVLIDNAANLVTQHLSAPTLNERAATLKAAMDALITMGLTGVHDAGISVDDYKAYQKLGKNHDMPMRIYAMLADSDAARKMLAKAPPKTQFDQRLILRSVKAWADGALGSRGAAMLEAYSDHPNHRGLLLYTPEQLEALTKLAINNGWQVNIHAIGDAGNRLVLDTFEKLSRDGKARALRHRIEHAQVIALNDIPRFRELEVIASIQPTHATSDMNMAEDRVGSERVKGAYAWRKLLDANVRLAGGSDFPVELANPFHGLYAAVTRKDRDGKPLDGWYPNEKLNRSEALKLFTVDAAYSGHMENDVGALQVGQWADFIVVDRDYFHTDEMQIDDINVLATYVAGKTVHQQ